MALWLFCGAAVVLAVVAIAATRRVGRRLRQLNQSYWELRYEYGQLRARVARLDPEPAVPTPPDPTEAVVGFVPLSSLKR